MASMPARKVLPADTPLRTRPIEYAAADPSYSAVWLYVELCPETVGRCDQGHWSLKVVTQGQETLYRVAGHAQHYSLQIINGIAPAALEGGLLLPVGAVDANGLRARLAAGTVNNRSRTWNSQQWVWDVLNDLFADVPVDPSSGMSLLDVLGEKAWRFAGEFHVFVPSLKWFLTFHPDYR